MMANLPKKKQALIEVRCNLLWFYWSTQAGTDPANVTSW